MRWSHDVDTHYAFVLRSKALAQNTSRPRTCDWPSFNSLTPCSSTAPTWPSSCRLRCWEQGTTTLLRLAQQSKKRRLKKRAQSPWCTTYLLHRYPCAGDGIWSDCVALLWWCTYFSYSQVVWVRVVVCTVSHTMEQGSVCTVELSSLRTMRTTKCSSGLTTPM
jgi:hypothetical protein